MDAIRKKMQSLKSETDGDNFTLSRLVCAKYLIDVQKLPFCQLGLYNTIAGFEEATREAAARADQVDFA